MSVARVLHHFPLDPASRQVRLALGEKRLAFAEVQVARDGALTRPIREITLRDILTHTSGLGEMTERAPHLTLEQTAALAAKQPLRFDPGTRWQYSTLGMDLLGRVVEVASGIPFDRFLQTRLFQPLGMENTTFWPTPDQAERFAQNYQIDPATKKLVPVEIPYLYHTALTDRQRP